MLVRGYETEQFKPLLKEWAELAKVPMTKFDVEIHRAKGSPSGSFLRDKHKIWTMITEDPWLFRRTSLITVYFNLDEMENNKYVFLHELGHLKQYRDKRWKIKGHRKFAEKRATEFALSLGCKPTAMYRGMKDAKWKSNKK